MAPQKWMTGKRAQAINHVLGTAKRRELFDAMLIEVAAGRWEELEPDGRSLYTIRWMAERKVADVYRTGPGRDSQQTWHEIVFVRLVTADSMPSIGHCAGPFSGRRDWPLTLTKALAVVRDPVTALGLDPVSALAWRLAWAPGTPEADYEPLTFAREDQVLPERYTDGIVPGHAARHALDDGVVALDRQLNPVTCRYCHSTSIPGRDVVFHPYTIEITELVPGARA